MGVSCVDHTAYLAAIADGETELVPASTLAHVAACPTCRGELETHHLMSSRLREALAADGARPRRTPPAATRRSRRRLVAAGTAVAVIVAVALSVGPFAQIWRGPDQVLAAASVAQGPPAYQSGDGQAIAAWCERQSGRPMPLVALSGLAPFGARFDHLEIGEVVTVDYVTDTGARVTVSWLDSSSAGPAGRRIEARVGEGRTVLLVRSAAGTAVVAGDAPASLLWSAAAQLETASLTTG
jgi:hypothetical protein